MKRAASGIMMAVFLVLFAAGASFAGEAKAKFEKGTLYWKGWPQGIAKGIVPGCGINVLGAGGDDILQATVDTYCAVKPGHYISFINPKVMDIYKKKGDKYPDGQTSVLQFEDIGVAFTTDHVGGKPVYGVVGLKDGKSIASKDANHPLNPDTCAKCHIGFKGVCKGFVCGNR